MLYYCASCAEHIINIGEPHSCKIECYDCYALLSYIGESHNCPIEDIEDEIDEGFIDQTELTYDKLKDLAIRIWTGEDIILVKFRNGQWWSAAIPQHIIDDLHQ